MATEMHSIFMTRQQVMLFAQLILPHQSKLHLLVKAHIGPLKIIAKQPLLNALHCFMPFVTRLKSTLKNWPCSRVWMLENHGRPLMMMRCHLSLTPSVSLQAQRGQCQLSQLENMSLVTQA